MIAEDKRTNQSADLVDLVKSAKSLVLILIENMELSKEDANAINVLKVVQEILKEVEDELL